MKNVVIGGTIVALVVVLFFAAWESMGDEPIRPAALAAVPATSLESPNGLYRIEATDGGILLSGPGVQVKVDDAQVKVLCGVDGRPSQINQTGRIVRGSPTTFFC